MKTRVSTWARRLAPVVLLATSFGLSLAGAPGAAADPPSGFSTATYATGHGPNALTNFVFISDRSMLTTAKCGDIRRADLSADGGSTQSTLFIKNIPVYCEHDRGLLGIATAPDFATPGSPGYRTVYTLYDYLNSGKATGKLTRWLVNSETAPTQLLSEQTVLDDMPSWSETGAQCDDSHTIGTVVAAPDGTLYVGNGDGSSYCSPDPSALNAQDLNSPRGKIFHINPDGTGVASNPFYDRADGNEWTTRIFAYGFRNPFRFSLQASTGTLYVGDVGWNSREELNIVAAGQNYGWPCYEGELSFRNLYQAYGDCTTMYSNGNRDRYGIAVTAPAYAWPHNGGNAAVGGDFYNGPNYPAQYAGAFFFGDFANGSIWTRTTDGVVNAFGDGGFDGAVAMRAGPGGDIFLANLYDSQIHRLRYTPVPNRFPIAQGAATPTTGNAPLAVSFSSAGSRDPDGDPISFEWDFGDGSAVSTAANPQHTYTSRTTYTAKLTVRDTKGAADEDTVVIATNNAAPVLTVQPLPAGVTYSVGSAVPITASATDPDGGPVTVTYQQIIHHCPVPGSCHLHPSGATPGPNGGTYTCVIDDHPDDSYLEVVVTAIDSGGATASKSVVIPAKQRVLTVSSSPPGVPILVNSTDSVTTPNLNQVVGAQNHVIAPASYGNLVFDGWSDGGARDHTFFMPDANVSLVARYRTASVPPVPPPSGGGWSLNGSAALQGGELVLTPAAPNQAGSAFWPQSVPTEGLRVSFDTTIDQGDGVGGADGLTFTMADPSAGPGALGAPAAGLGFGGIAGVAVALDTYQGPLDPSDNFVGVATEGLGGQLAYLATATNVPELIGASHHVGIEVVGGRLRVSVDGGLVIDKAVALPNKALLGFTAGTGGATNRHRVSNVSIQPPSPNLLVSPTSIDFGTVPVGVSTARQLTISNAGTAALTVFGVTTSGGAFAVPGAPAPDTVIGAGQSVPVTVTLTPPTQGNWTDALTVTTSAGDATVMLSGSSSFSTGPLATADSLFTPVQPYRLLDTRIGDLSPSAPAALLAAGNELVVNLFDQPGAPSRPTGAMLNVTVTDPVAAGFLRAYPCGSVPANSTVNFETGQTAANLATVRVPADGRVCFWSMVDTNLVVDVAGWYAPPGAGGTDEPAVAYQTVEPVRILDTRRAELAPSGAAGKLQPFQEVAFSLAGWSGFPADARAALLNLTVTEPDGPGYLRVYPCGEEQGVSNVNFAPGQTVANLAAVKVAAGGQVCFRASTSAHIVVDLAGWYAPGPGALLAVPDPIRLLDTRDPALAPAGVIGPLRGGGELAFAVAGSAGVPAGASSIVLNVTATNSAADGYVAVYPCGTAPFVSNVNYRAGQVAAANLAVVKLPADGRVCFSSFATTDLVVDLAGWYVG